VLFQQRAERCGVLSKRGCEASRAASWKVSGDSGAPSQHVGSRVKQPGPARQRGLGEQDSVSRWTGQVVEDLADQ